MTAPVPAWRTTLGGAELDAVRALVDDVAGADGVAAFSEPVLLDLGAPIQPAGTRHLLLHDAEGALAAYAHVDETEPADRVVELAVAPGHRRRGVGGALAGALAAELPAARAWAHGDLPGAARLAERHGLHRDRELWMMRRDVTAGPLPERPAPDGVTIRPVRVGTDEPAVVAVNHRAFAWHPEQGAWTLDDVTVREGEPWFDPAGLLLAWDDATGELLGLHWTKTHPASPAEPEALGEVYVVGVDPAAQGRGLGGALTLAGLRHLAGRGYATVILYVEGDNAAAIATYTKLGFARGAVDVSYRR